MLVKVHKGYRVCVAVCDSDLIGKKFEDDLRQIDLTGTFFQGEEKSIEETRKILFNAKSEDASFNLVGNGAVGLARELGIVGGEVMKIKGVPVALVLL